MRELRGGLCTCCAPLEGFPSEVRSDAEDGGGLWNRARLGHDAAAFMPSSRNKASIGMCAHCKQRHGEGEALRRRTERGSVIFVGGARPPHHAASQQLARQRSGARPSGVA